MGIERWQLIPRLKHKVDDMFPTVLIPQTIANSSSAKVPFTWQGVGLGLMHGIPIALAGSMIAMVFGLMALKAGLDQCQTLIMSALVFAGSAQFIALDMWSMTTLSIVSIGLATLAINIRYTLMGAAIGPWLNEVPAWQRYLSVFFMTDECWALSMHQLQKGYRDRSYLIGVGLMFYTLWILGSYIGFQMGLAGSDSSVDSLQFIFPALFITLTTINWKRASQWLPWLAAAVVSILSSQYLPGASYLLLGGIVGAGVGVWYERI